MAKPVGIAVTEEGRVYVVTDDGSVYYRRDGVDDWRQASPIPGTPAANKK